MSFNCLVIFSILSAITIFYSPDDYQQGNAVKIMYVHVPAAWMSLLIYTLMAVFNVSGFVWKNPYFYVISKVIAPIGLIFTLITLVTVVTMRSMMRASSSPGRSRVIWWNPRMFMTKMETRRRVIFWLMCTGASMMLAMELWETAVERELREL